MEDKTIPVDMFAERFIDKGALCSSERELVCISSLLASTGFAVKNREYVINLIFFTQKYTKLFVKEIQ